MATAAAAARTTVAAAFQPRGIRDVLAVHQLEVLGYRYLRLHHPRGQPPYTSLTAAAQKRRRNNYR